MTNLNPGQARQRALTPYLAVGDARAAVDWYAEVFDGERRAEPIVGADGRIGYVDLAIGDMLLMLSDEHPEMGIVAPRRGGVSQSIVLVVPDADATVRRAVERGAHLERPVTDEPYGPTGVIVDPFGHRWMVQTPPEQRPPQETPPQASRVAVTPLLAVRSGAEAVEFYKRAFGAVELTRLTAPTAPSMRSCRSPVPGSR